MQTLRVNSKTPAFKAASSGTEHLASVIFYYVDAVLVVWLFVVLSLAWLNFCSKQYECL